MCGVCFKCEWLGSTRIPVYNCCGTVSTGCLMVHGYYAFCTDPNEYKCRNCILCTIPFMCASIGSIIPFMCELIIIPIYSGCGYVNGNGCICYKKIADINSIGFPSMSEVEPVAKLM